MSKPWNWKDLGKVRAIEQTIQNRLRAMSEKGGELDFSFVAWLATEAPDKVYTDLLGHALNAWQNHLSAKRLSTNLEWAEEYPVSEFWQYVEHYVGEQKSEEGWRLPTIRELRVENVAHPGSFKNQDQLYWSSEVADDFAKTYCPTEDSVDESFVGTMKAHIRLVRTILAEKPMPVEILGWNLNSVDGEMTPLSGLRPKPK